MKVLLTGANGFLGRALSLSLRNRHDILGVVRSTTGSIPGVPYHVVGNIGDQTDWSRILRGQEVVVHAAARAHILKDDSSNPLEQYRKVNVLGTIKLAKQAAAAGVQRFIYVSSVGVHGNASVKPFSAQDNAAPVDPYAKSKWEAEQVLSELCGQTGMSLVIVRPPLVYGPNAPGNFGTLVKMVEKQIPLPLGAIPNKRSLVALDNLVDLIITCIDHPAAANQVFLAGDGEDLSTPELLRRVGAAMGQPVWLLPVPVGLLQLAASVLGKKAMAQRLLGSLQVDISKTREVLSWEPPISVDEGLRRCFIKDRDG